MSLWWHGPEWLTTPEFWPPNISLRSEQGSIPELRPQVSLVGVASSENDIFEKFSSFKKLQHVVAYVFRFMHNCRYRLTRSVGELSVSELHETTNKLIKLAQFESFHKEYHALQTNPVVKLILYIWRSHASPHGMTTSVSEQLSWGGVCYKTSCLGQRLAALRGASLLFLIHPSLARTA
jgi:hypothetical protein